MYENARKWKRCTKDFVRKQKKGTEESVQNEKLKRVQLNHINQEESNYF